MHMQFVQKKTRNGSEGKPTTILTCCQQFILETEKKSICKILTEKTIYIFDTLNKPFTESY